jgi:hypothetical protein
MDDSLLKYKIRLDELDTKIRSLFAWLENDGLAFPTEELVEGEPPPIDKEIVKKAYQKLKETRAKLESNDQDKPSELDLIKLTKEIGDLVFNEQLRQEKLARIKMTQILSVSRHGFDPEKI